MAWTIVQTRAIDFASSTGARSLQFSSQVKAGDCLVVIAATGEAGGLTDATVALEDTQGNVFTKIAGYSQDSVGGNVISAWMTVAKSTDPSAGPFNSVTVTPTSSNPTWMGIDIAEVSFTGATGYAADGAVTNHGNSSSATSGSIPVSGANEIAFGAFSQGQGVLTWTPGTGFTNAVKDTNGNNIATYLDYQAGVSAAVTDNGTFGGSAPYAAVGFSIKATVPTGASWTPWLYEDQKRKPRKQSQRRRNRMIVPIQTTKILPVHPRGVIVTRQGSSRRGPTVPLQQPAVPFPFCSPRRIVTTRVQSRRPIALPVAGAPQTVPIERRRAPVVQKLPGRQRAAIVLASPGATVERILPVPLRRPVIQRIARRQTKSVVLGGSTTTVQSPLPIQRPRGNVQTRFIQRTRAVPISVIAPLPIVHRAIHSQPQPTETRTRTVLVPEPTQSVLVHRPILVR